MLINYAIKSNHLVGCGGRTTGRTTPARAIPRPAVAVVIATRRNWRRLRGTCPEHAQHLLRRYGSLLVAVAARVLAHRPPAGGRRCGQGSRRTGGHMAGGWGAEVGAAASGQGSALRRHARRVVVVVRRVGALDDGVGGARRRVVQPRASTSASQRASAVADTCSTGCRRCCWSAVRSAARRRTDHAEGQSNVLRLIAAGDCRSTSAQMVRTEARRTARRHTRRRLRGARNETAQASGSGRRSKPEASGRCSGGVVSVGSGAPARGSKITEFGIIVASCAHCQGVAVVWNATAPKAHYTAGAEKYKKIAN